MSIIRYQHTDTQFKYWNTDWILRVETSEEGEVFRAEVTTAIPPGPMTKLSGMEVARPFYRFILKAAEARQFMEGYDRLCPPLPPS